MAGAAVATAETQPPRLALAQVTATPAAVENEPAAAGDPPASGGESADEPPPSEPANQSAPAGPSAFAEPGAPTPPEPLPPPVGAKKLSPDHDIWIDLDKRVVIIDANVSLRQGVLEMFACTRNTKEHESVLSANTLAFAAHTALLRLGAEEGRPVRFQPEYAPPTGAEIEIQLQWRDRDGVMQTARAQDWVRDVDTGKAMTQPWVFAGSGFWKDEESGREFYMAEQGDFICVSNFTTAMLDVPVESSQSQEGLLFEAFTERIPPLGCPVRMILRPKPAAGAAPAESDE